jgi:uncharacterized caspase-like protein
MAKVALLIGVSEYEPGLNPLPAAVKDIEAMQRVLKDPEMGGFDTVKTLSNPDPQTMQYEIETLFSSATKDDLVVLFFSGHGIKDDSNNLFFATRITRKNDKGTLIQSTAVPSRFVHDIMNNSRTRRQAIILDCCFSGAFDPALSKDDGSIDLHTQLGAEGRIVLASSSSTQYSFEQQGSELSLYTRYLVEGIETGAGDQDEDGKISMLELHEYATSKVRETAPNMTPQIITLKEMGFEIVLAKAKVTDPKLRYRKQVKRYTSQGNISSIGRTILDRLQPQLNLSLEITRAIEAEVLRPYQEYLDNLKGYRQAFSEAIEHEYPLSSQIHSELGDLREILGLRQEDVDSFEQEILAQTAKKLEVEQEDYQNKLQRYEQSFRHAIEAEYPFSEDVRNSFRDFQQSLGLKNHDIAQIETAAIQQSKLVKSDIHQLNVSRQIEIFKVPEDIKNQVVPVRGEDIQVDLGIDMNQARLGTVQEVSFIRTVCPNPVKIIELDQTSFLSEMEAKTLSVTVPPNSKNGSNLRLIAQGNQGLNGGESGDVYVRLIISNPDVKPNLKRKNELIRLMFLLGFGFVFLFGIGFASWISAINHNQTSQQTDSKYDYPKAQCGSGRGGYQVYIRYTSSNFEKIKQDFCQDAFIQTFSNGSTQVQVASFATNDEAKNFESFLEKYFPGEVYP